MTYLEKLEDIRYNPYKLALQDIMEEAHVNRTYYANIPGLYWGIILAKQRLDWIYINTHNGTKIEVFES